METNNTSGPNSLLLCHYRLKYMWPIGNRYHMTETAVLMRKKLYSSFSLLKIPCAYISWILTRVVVIMFKMMGHQKKMKTQGMRNMRKMMEMILWRSWLFKIVLKNRWSLGEAPFEEDPADTRARDALLRNSPLEKRKKKSWRLVLKL